MRILTVPKCGLLIASAMMLSGCLAAAIAPAGLQALETLGVSAGNSLSGKDSDVDKVDEDLQSGDCQQLLLAVPYIAEIRTKSDRTAKLRQWTIGMVKGEQRWTVVHDPGTDSQGWRTETPIGHLNFNPPLETALASTKSRYMISAPTDPASALEANQLLSLTIVFGPRIGTYDWNGKRYEYAVANKLPCVPGPSEPDKNSPRS